MSSSLYWLPQVEEKWKPVSCEYDKKGDYETDIKFAIAPKYFDHDGSLGSEPITLSEEDIGYLEGVRDSGYSQGANELIKAILKYGSIRICLIS